MFWQRLNRLQVGLWASLTGTVIVAVCCFTPLLVITLSAIGLGAVIGYLDYILWPALFVMLILTFISYQRYRRSLSRSL
jgi:mercuric ion transport protein